MGGDTAKIPAHFQAHKADGDDCNYKGQSEGGSYKILLTWLAQWFAKN